VTHFAIIFSTFVQENHFKYPIFDHSRRVTGKVVFPGWDGKFLISGVEEGNQ